MLVASFRGDWKVGESLRGSGEDRWSFIVKDGFACYRSRYVFFCSAEVINKLGEHGVGVSAGMNASYRYRYDVQVRPRSLFVYQQPGTSHSLATYSFLADSLNSAEPLFHVKADSPCLPLEHSRSASPNHLQLRAFTSQK